MPRSVGGGLLMNNSCDVIFSITFYSSHFVMSLYVFMLVSKFLLSQYDCIIKYFAEWTMQLYWKEEIRLLG